mmetsp:Transcript_55575/g.129599  ORF Transcript_55575/g.129599 Transcript_55575/m.129599 type:complete len:227 (+) Transcript_55575:121-801(+)
MGRCAAYQGNRSDCWHASTGSQAAERFPLFLSPRTLQACRLLHRSVWRKEGRLAGKGMCRISKSHRSVIQQLHDCKSKLCQHPPKTLPQEVLAVSSSAPAFPQRLPDVRRRQVAGALGGPPPEEETVLQPQTQHPAQAPPLGKGLRKAPRVVRMGHLPLSTLAEKGSMPLAGLIASSATTWRFCLTEHLPHIRPRLLLQPLAARRRNLCHPPTPAGAPQLLGEHCR